MALVYLLFWLLLYPLRWLLGSGQEASAPPATFQMPPAPPASEGSSFCELLKSALFWAVFAGVIVYTLVALWRQGTIHRFVPGIGKLGELATRLVLAIAAWIAGLLRLAARGAAAVVHMVTPAGRGIGGSGRRAGWLRDLLGGRDPRHLVIAT